MAFYPSEEELRFGADLAESIPGRRQNKTILFLPFPCRRNAGDPIGRPVCLTILRQCPVCEPIDHRPWTRRNQAHD